MKMSFKTLCELLRSDISRYKATGGKSTLRIIFYYQAFWATSFHRIFHYFYMKTSNCILTRTPVAIAYLLIDKIIQITTMITIASVGEIGKGLYLQHYGPIFLGAKKIGENCNIGNSTMIGFGRLKGKPGNPEIGNRVFIGPGAKIFGPVKIGNDVAIGANAVVTEDVPDRALVGGIPARIINFHGSFAYIKYFGQETDVERMESLKIARQLDPAFDPDADSLSVDEV